MTPASPGLSPLQFFPRSLPYRFDRCGHDVKDFLTSEVTILRKDRTVQNVPAVQSLPPVWRRLPVARQTGAEVPSTSLRCAQDRRFVQAVTDEIRFKRRQPRQDVPTSRQLRKRRNDCRLPFPVARCSFLNQKADPPLFGLRRRHELPDRLE